MQKEQRPPPLFRLPAPPLSVPRLPLSLSHTQSHTRARARAHRLAALSHTKQPIHKEAHSQRSPYTGFELAIKTQAQTGEDRGTCGRRGRAGARIPSTKTGRGFTDGPPMVGHVDLPIQAGPVGICILTAPLVRGYGPVLYICGGRDRSLYHLRHKLYLQGLTGLRYFAVQVHGDANCAAAVRLVAGGPQRSRGRARRQGRCRWRCRYGGTGILFGGSVLRDGVRRGCSGSLGRVGRGGRRYGGNPGVRRTACQRFKNVL